MFEAQIQAGAKLLDEKVGPDWFKKIDLQHFHMHDCFYCVLGQLFGHYIDGLEKIWHLENAISYDYKLPREHGFSTVEFDENEYDHLTQEWMAYIGLLVHRSGNFDA